MRSENRKKQCGVRSEYDRQKKRPVMQRIS
jgi:hypothetical protein